MSFIKYTRVAPVDRVNKNNVKVSSMSQVDLSIFVTSSINSDSADINKEKNIEIKTLRSKPSLIDINIIVTAKAPIVIKPSIILRKIFIMLPPSIF
jgi:hypothetical protein